MRHLHLLSLLLLLNPCTAFASNYGNVTVSEITSIYDADTFRANIDGYPPIIGERISIRVNGVDAPEIRGQCESEKVAARQAKQFTVNILRSAKQVELRNMQRGKYFRILADVFVDGISLADALISAGYARAYHGEKRTSWCNTDT